jgi:hypothetical protein
VFLIDASDQEKWQGVFSLNVSNRLDEAGAPCRMDTETDGSLDLARPLIDCHLLPGPWRVTWKGPADRDWSLDLQIESIPKDAALEIRGKAAGEEVRAALAEELGLLISPYYHLVPNPANPKVEIQLRELTVDSLEGIYFASLQGNVRFPGSTGKAEVAGKAGHTDKRRAQILAVRDFAKQVGRRAATADFTVR